MATLARDYSPSPPPSCSRRCKIWARRGECICCVTLAYFPLFFVFGLTTWAVYVQVTTSLLPKPRSYSDLPTPTGIFTAFLGLLLYALANISYFTAVFTNPGSPSDPPSIRKPTTRGRGNYESLPTHEHPEPQSHSELAFVSLTAKTDGRPRYCKKCALTKPDRAHHCSTCNRCVLKMDHHCPWLATCVGLHNYKPFLLFLIYTSLFCWLCFPVSATWVWAEIASPNMDIDDGLKVVNVIMLAVLSGIIGLVLGGFAAWHCYLACKGQTTIESLEKTRYLSPLKKSMEQQFKRQNQRNYLANDQERGNKDETIGEQLKEIHANILPGITRPEEGLPSPYPASSPTPSPLATQSHLSTTTTTSSSSPAQSALRRSYAEMEAQRERQRHADYLDELDSEKLPHAFDLGWRRNLRLLFGPNPLLWFLPVCNSEGDGWTWEVSEKWQRQRDEVARERRARDEAERERMRRAGWGGDDDFEVEFGQPASRYFETSGAGRHYNAEIAPWHGSGHPNQAPWSPSWAEPNEEITHSTRGTHSSSDGDSRNAGQEGEEQRYLTTSAGVASVPHRGRRSLGKADALLGRPGGVSADVRYPASRDGRDGRRRSGEGDEYDTSSDEGEVSRSRQSGGGGGGVRGGDWNDIPEDMLATGRNSKSTGGNRDKSGGRRKGD